MGSIKQHYVPAKGTDEGAQRANNNINHKGPGPSLKILQTTHAAIRACKTMNKGVKFAPPFAAGL
jgi:hypothetical protein